MIRAESSSPKVARHLAEHGPFDLVLIDGDHSEEGVRRDLELVRPHARAIALHDIVGENTRGSGRSGSRCAATTPASTSCTNSRPVPETAAAIDGTALGIGLAVRRER